MKKSTIYGILLIGVLISISYLNRSIDTFNETIIQSSCGDLFKSNRVGDLFVLMNEEGAVNEFFKIVGNPTSDSISIAVGDSSYNQNFKHRTWIAKGIDRPIYFNSELRQITPQAIADLSKRAATFNVYRHNYPPDNIPLFYQLMHSPVAIISLIIFFGFLIEYSSAT